MAARSASRLLTRALSARAAAAAASVRPRAVAACFRDASAAAAPQETNALSPPQRRGAAPEAGTAQPRNADDVRRDGASIDLKAKAVFDACFRCVLQARAPASSRAAQPSNARSPKFGAGAGAGGRRTACRSPRAPLALPLAARRARRSLPRASCRSPLAACAAPLRLASCRSRLPLATADACRCCSRLPVAPADAAPFVAGALRRSWG
jgi:hypothetical protein